MAIAGITHLPDFIPYSETLFALLKHRIHWDTRMQARKTASYGVAYNYSQISYPYQRFLTELHEVMDILEASLGYRPNNCLVNYYENGSSTMGWHADQTDILEPGTGVAIISLGASRILKFREIANKENKVDYLLESGSLLFMNPQTQDEWQHAIPESDTEEGRISLTFRKIISER